MKHENMNRCWCGKAQYPGFAPFIFGTAVVDIRATDQEVREALYALWAEISPHPAPEFTAIPGSVFFAPDAYA